MKQNFYVIIVILSMTVLSSSINAKSMGIVDMQISLIDPSLENPSHPKSPVEIPDVSIVDHTLYFDTPCDGCTLNIVDENDMVVYTLVIPTGTTSLVLPATLSGEYELQIISGNYLYNVCNGYVRIQENSQDEISNEEKCMFVDNFILQKIEEPEIQSGVPFGNIYNKVIYCKDSDGIMTDYTGIVAASTLVKLMGRLVHVKYVDEE